MVVHIDAKPVCAATTAISTKISAERSLLTHVLHLRELLDLRVVDLLVCIDTMDIVADGLAERGIKQIRVACSNEWRTSSKARSLSLAEQS